MKIIFTLFLSLIAVSAFAWDPNTEATWVATLAPIMLNNNVESLTKVVTETSETSITAQAIVGIAEHNLSRLAPLKGWAKKAATTLKTLTDSGIPEELKAILLPYYGSSLSMEARDDFNPISKLFTINEAFGVLDKAVQRYGSFSYYPWLIRAQVDWKVPDFFFKKGQAKSDLQVLLDWHQQHPPLPQSALAQVHLTWGEVQKNEGQLHLALAAWKLAVQEDPQSLGPGKRAGELLARYEE